MPSESKDAIDRDVEEPGHLVALCHSDPAWAASRLRVERAARRKAEQTLSTIADNGCITKTEITCADVLDSPEEWCMACFAALEIRGPAEGDIDSAEDPAGPPEVWPYPDHNPSSEFHYYLPRDIAKELSNTPRLDSDTYAIATIKDLLAFSRAELKKAGFLSDDQMTEICASLEGYGMHLKGEGPDAK